MSARTTRKRRSQWASLVRGVRYRLVVPVFRSTHHAEYTARGVANGVFWGLTPTVGLQTLAITATWLIGRKAFRKDSSLLQAYIWVWVNNPVTMIPMYYAFYVTGLSLVGDTDLSSGYAGFVELWTRASALTWWDGFTTILRAIGGPLFLGAVPYAVLGAALSYRWAAQVVRRRQQRIRGLRPASSGA
jgi:uncharacterized protein